MTRESPAETLAFALALAQDVGRQLMSMQGRVRARRKADGSLISEADEAADRFICDALRQRYPGYGILSEETSQKMGSEEAVWVVDPLDGTTNYVAGLPIWGVLICLLDQGRPHLAVLNFPRLGECYHAQRAGGAYCNQEAIQASRSAAFSSHQIITSCTLTRKAYNITIPGKMRLLGSAGYEFGLVARGAALLGLAMRPHLWDLAGGWLLVEEAGGLVRVLQGAEPFPATAGTDYQNATYPVLLAGNETLYAEGLARLELRLSNQSRPTA